MKLINTDKLKAKIESDVVEFMELSYEVENERQIALCINISIGLLIAIRVIENADTVENAWIPVSERLPTLDEYRKNDARFIVSDGNRVYQDYYNIYDGCWLKSPNDLVVAWQPLPDKYKFPVDI